MRAAGALLRDHSPVFILGGLRAAQAWGVAVALAALWGVRAVGRWAGEASVAAE